MVVGQRAGEERVGEGRDVVVERPRLGLLVADRLHQHQRQGRDANEEGEEERRGGAQPIEQPLAPQAPAPDGAGIHADFRSRDRHAALSLPHAPSAALDHHTVVEIEDLLVVLRAHGERLNSLAQAMVLLAANSAQRGFGVWPILGMRLNWLIDTATSSACSEVEELHPFERGDRVLGRERKSPGRH